MSLGLVKGPPMQQLQWLVMLLHLSKFVSADSWLASPALKHAKFFVSIRWVTSLSTPYPMSFLYNMPNSARVWSQIWSSHFETGLQESQVTARNPITYIIRLGHYTPQHPHHLQGIDSQDEWLSSLWRDCLITDWSSWTHPYLQASGNTRKTPPLKLLSLIIFNSKWGKGGLSMYRTW